MTATIVDVRVPADAFPLGQLLSSFPDITIDLERIVPSTDEIMPLFWVSGADETAVVKTLATDPLVRSVERLIRSDDSVLYSVHWHRSINSLVGVIVANDIDILSATGSAMAWQFRLQFRNHETVTDFRTQCAANDIALELRRIYHPSVQSASELVTDAQLEALRAARDTGYWDVPRRITQTALAQELGISDNSLSQRLRRGTSVAVEAFLAGVEDDWSRPSSPDTTAPTDNESRYRE